LVVDPRKVVAPAVVDEVDLDRLAEHHGLEVLIAFSMPTRSQALGEVFARRVIAAHTDGARRALEHV
jgi:hypothetical protein